MIIQWAYQWKIQFNAKRNKQANDVILSQELISNKIILLLNLTAMILQITLIKTFRNIFRYKA